MKQCVNTEQRFNEIEMALENMELNLLQAVWSLEKSVQIQLEANRTLNEGIRTLLNQFSKLNLDEFDPTGSHSKTKNNQIR